MQAAHLEHTVIRVVLVLHFHPCEFANVNIMPSVSPGRNSLGYFHIEVESFEGFVLAVGDAGDLGIGPSR